MTPQPEELQNEGISFVLSLQYLYDADRVVQQHEILTLNVLNMETWNHEMEIGEITVYRGASMDPQVRKAEVYEKHDLTNLCRPCGRRDCQIFCAGDVLDDLSSCRLDNGALIRVNIGPWHFIDDLRRSFGDAEDLVTDINAAQERLSEVQIVLNMYGHRFIPLGRRTRTLLLDAPLTCESLALQIGSAWMNQPIDRAKIFRARSLESEENHCISIHLLIGFDLRPGHALILAVGRPDLSLHEIMAGPEFLPPHIWDLDFGGQAFRNPLTDRSYEILNTEDGAFQGQMHSGDVAFYVDPPGLTTKQTIQKMQSSFYN